LSVPYTVLTNTKSLPFWSERVISPVANQIPPMYLLVFLTNRIYFKAGRVVFSWKQIDINKLTRVVECNATYTYIISFGITLKMFCVLNLIFIIKLPGNSHESVFCEMCYL